MAMDFPASPTNGQIYSPANAPSYMWDSAAGVWGVYLPTAGVGAAYAHVGDSPPANPQNGQMWIETDSGLTYAYVNDGTSSQWIQINGAGLTDAPSDGLTWARKNGVWVATDGTGGAMNGPAFLAKCSANQSIPSQSTAAIIFPTEVADSDNAYNPTNGRFTPQVAGYYMFHVNFLIATANPSRGFSIIMKNAGLDVARGQDMSATGSVYYAVQGSGMTYMNGTTDYVYGCFWSVAACTVAVDSNFGGALVRKA